MIQHVCFSGSIACSGASPCPACFDMLKGKVLPVAMVAGGFNGTEAQADAFFRGFFEGFKRLHNEMQATGTHVSLVDGRQVPFRLTDLEPVIRTLQEQAMERERVAAAAAAIPVVNVGPVTVSLPGEPVAEVSTEVKQVTEVSSDPPLAAATAAFRNLADAANTLNGHAKANGKKVEAVPPVPVAPVHTITAAEIAFAAISKD